MQGFCSKGIQLGYKSSSSASAYTNLTNLQEIPDLGGSAESIEITTLADSAHMYMNGLLDYGDSLDFTFLYDPTQFAALQALTGSINWQVGLPDGTDGAIGTTCTFTGTPSVKLTGAGINAAMTYTLSIKPDSAMVWA